MRIGRQYSPVDTQALFRSGYCRIIGTAGWDWPKEKITPNLQNC